MIVKGHTFFVDINKIEDILGGLDPDETAMVTFQSPNKFKVSFQTLQTFDEHTVPNERDVVLLL